MTIRVGFSEAPGLSASPGQRVARIGVCSAGLVGQVYEFAGGQQAAVPETIGYGDLAVTQERACLYGRSASLAVPADVALPGSIGAVVQDGGGPVITAAAKPAEGDVIEGPWISMPNLKLSVETDGELGVARLALFYDGLTQHDIVDTSPEMAASKTGTVDITALTSTQLSALNTETFIEDPDGNGPFTTTFAGVTEYQDIIDQVQESMQEAATLLGSADLTAYTPGDINGKTFLATVTVAGVVVASVSVLFAGVASLANIATQIAAASGVTSALETGDFISVTTDATGADVVLTIGNGTANTDLGFTNGQSDTGAQYGTASLVGGKYLRITANTLGPTGTLDIGAGTANTALGFTDNTSDIGVASTYEVPGTGVILTFAAGGYEEDTTYEIPVTGPQMSLAGMQAAAEALRLDGAAFGVLHIVHEPADGLDLAAWQAALKEIVDGWWIAEENAIFPKWVIGAPLSATDDWQSTDNDVKTNLVGTQAGVKMHTIVHGDAWAELVSYSGRHRVQLAMPYVERMARFPLNVDPGLGSNEGLENCFLKNADGSRRARTEADSVVKMQDHGFAVLKNEKQAPQIRAGRTRAPGTSQLVSEAAARAALEIARVLYEVALRYENATPALDSNGQLRSVDAASILQAFQGAINESILRPGFASSAAVELLPLTTDGGADTLNVKCVFQRLANIKDVNITVFVTNQTVTIEGA